MSDRKWIRCRYFKPQPTQVKCEVCREPFSYVRRSKPRRYCSVCAHEVRLKQMRNCNALIRNLERAARETVMRKEMLR